MARWHSTEPPHLEAPSWYRVYDPAMWDEPDSQEIAMIEGSRSRWPECADGSREWLEFHAMHAERRWAEAKVVYRNQHPDFATQEFHEILSRRAVRRAQPDL